MAVTRTRYEREIPVGDRSGWERVDREIPGSDRSDPYLAWVRHAGAPYYFIGDVEHRYPIIIQLANMTAQEFARKEWGPDLDAWMRIPDVYRNPSSGMKRATFCTATVTDAFFSKLDTVPALRQAIARYAIGLPVQKHTPARSTKTQPLSAKPKPGVVVVGIIDDGIAFGHRRFRRGPGTRVEFFWGQDGAVGAVPGMGYGCELKKRNAPGQDGIDKRLADTLRAGPLYDEDEFYRDAGYCDFSRRGHKPLAQRAAHGTPALDLASGFDPATAPANRPLVCVQLPLSTTAATGGGDLAPHVLDGMRYILDRADDIAFAMMSGPLPVVVNLSYATIAGPHDGSSILEQAIEELIALREAIGARLRVVMPAGNSYLARCHASFRLSGVGAERQLTWRVQPDDATPSFMEIWLPAQAAHPKVELTITTPTGIVSPPVQEGTSWAWQPNGQVLCEAIYINAVGAGAPRNRILIALAPTTTLHPSRQVAPCGAWRISIRNPGPAPRIKRIDAWIQRDDTPYGYPRRARQSRFSDPRYEHCDQAGRFVEIDNASPIKRAGTLNALASGPSTIVIAGFRRSDWKPARYSGAGVRNRACRWPNAMAPCEDSPGHYGLLAAGTRGSSKVAMSGTSFAAPQVTRIVANELALGNPGDGSAVETLAAASEATRPASAPAQPSGERSGGGRLMIAPLVKR
jgi:hypothetical protein